MPRRSNARHSAFFVPGRIEVLGKHTDYAGGSSLVVAAEQGFCLVAAPRDQLHGHNTAGHAVRLQHSGDGKVVVLDGALGRFDVGDTHVGPPLGASQPDRIDRDLRVAGDRQQSRLLTLPF